MTGRRAVIWWRSMHDVKEELDVKMEYDVKEGHDVEEEQVACGRGS